MELKEFIREAIIECVEGIVLTQKDERIKNIGAIVSPTWSQKNRSGYKDYEKGDVKDVEFEVTVSVSDKEGGDFGINVFQIAKAGANKNSENSKTSKIKLSIPVMFPSYNVEND